MDFEKWYNSYKFLMELGFDLERNNAGDLVAAIYEVYDHYEEYVNSSLNS